LIYKFFRNYRNFFCSKKIKN